MTICASACSGGDASSLNDAICPGDDNTTDSNPYRKILQQESRKIGYAICEASRPEDRKVAILWFYPLSGHSLIVESAATSFSKYRASVISVDRPNIGDTSSAVSTTKGNNHSLDRIRLHALDVLAVLQNHKIERVYLLGVCLGHVYAVQVARQLIKREGESNLPKLEGLTLVAPFVSTACPHSWHVARLGASVPSFILSAATHSLISLGGALMSSFLTPDRVEKLITEEERGECEWTDEDFDIVVSNALEMYKLTNRAKATEAQLGADPTWQQISDDFAVESGCGLILDGNNESKKEGSPSPSPSSKGSKIPIAIYACREDKLASLDSVEWIARRCYGGTERIRIQEQIQSHELMTMLGGPPRNPVLMHKIADTWGLL